ncbi:MAG TPA: hypothetical protein VII28_16560 [Puia sp.]
MKKMTILILFFSIVTKSWSGDSRYAKKNWAGAKMKYDSIRHSSPVFESEANLGTSQDNPCGSNPRNHDFDFWIGDWTCYRTGTDSLAGYSHIESMAGGCAILENYSSARAYSGKSFNYYDTVSGKWKQDWIGSDGPSDRQHYDQGEFSNGRMHFTYETTNTKGEKIKGNFIFYFISRDSVRQYQDVIDAHGKTASVTYDLMYIRRK